MSTTRWRIMNSLLARLNAITTTNGYQQDMGQVTRENISPELVKQWPCVAVLAEDAEIEDMLGGVNGSRHMRLPIVLRGMVMKKSDVPGQTDEMLEDLLAAIDTTDYEDYTKILAIEPGDVWDDDAYSEVQGYGSVELRIVFFFSLESAGDIRLTRSGDPRTTRDGDVRIARPE